MAVGWRRRHRDPKKGQGREWTLFYFDVPGMRGWLGIQGHETRLRSANLGRVYISAERIDILCRAAEYRLIFQAAEDP
jgi:hypothetical protein